VLGEADGLTLGLGADPADADVAGETVVLGEVLVADEADEVWAGVAVRVRVGVAVRAGVAAWVGGVGPSVAVGVGPGEVELGVAVEVGWVRALGASRVQAAITTMPLAGSALPPTPARSTK
jgi:hypothetical protein